MSNPFDAVHAMRPGLLQLQALPPLSLYVHLPWCIKKCPYCDFNSHEWRDDVQGMPEQRYIDALLAAYHERTAAWTFTTALHRFRTLGPTADATKALRTAIKANTHVAPMLLGTAPMPDELPDSYIMGQPSEAAIYVSGSISTWIDAAGACEWLAQVSRPSPGGRAGSTRRLR